MVGETLEPVAIGRLERFVGDRAIAEGWARRPVYRAEPACASASSAPAPPAWPAPPTWRKAGCEVTVYEAFHLPGGVLRYGIPDFRLPNEVIDAEIDALRRLGVTFECNTLVGRLFTIEQMIDELGYRRRVHRHRRRLPGHARHPRRFAERRAVGQRIADALQPDAGARLPGCRHADPAGPARRRGGRGQHRHGRHARLRSGSAPKRSPASIAAAAPNARRAPRKCITPSRRASRSTG